MVEERLSRNFTSGEESSDEEAASPIGSVLTVKYKSGSAIDASVLPHNHPITNGIICSLSDDPIDNHQMLHVESASIFFKVPTNCLNQNFETMLINWVCQCLSRRSRWWRSWRRKSPDVCCVYGRPFAYPFCCWHRFAWGKFLICSFCRLVLHIIFRWHIYANGQWRDSRLSASTRDLHKEFFTFPFWNCRH